MNSPSAARSPNMISILTRVGSQHSTLPRRSLAGSRTGLCVRGTPSPWIGSLAHWTQSLCVPGSGPTSPRAAPEVLAGPGARAPVGVAHEVTAGATAVAVIARVAGTAVAVTARVAGTVNGLASETAREGRALPAPPAARGRGDPRRTPPVTRRAPRRPPGGRRNATTRP